MYNDDLRLDDQYDSYSSKIRELLTEACEAEGWDVKEADGGDTLLVSQKKKGRFTHLASLSVSQVSVISAKKYPAMFRKICEAVEAEIKEDQD